MSCAYDECVRHSVLRYESVLLGTRDARLWPHLRRDVSRVLDLADHDLTFGTYNEALTLLDPGCPDVQPPLRENGAVLPRESPLFAYYRGYVRERLGRDGRADFEAARVLSTTYVFPQSRVLLRRAACCPACESSRCNRTLLAPIAVLASGLTEPAVAAWQRARQLQPSLPTLHRNWAGSCSSEPMAQK